MSINETVTKLSSIHQALQQGAINEAALLTMEALEEARTEEEAYEAYLEARYACVETETLTGPRWAGYNGATGADDINTEDLPF